MADVPPPEQPASETPGPAAPTPAPTGEVAGRYSPDGFWWWDGSSWKPAYSQDRLWRWTGQTWVPTQAAPTKSGGGSGLLIGLIVGAFVLVVLVVAAIVVGLLYFVGPQITNVFSNVAAGLSSPSP